MARVNRGFAYGQRGREGDADRAIADYTAVIDTPDAPAEPRAMALNNRGLTYGRRGQEGDADRAIADYTAVIDMPDAPAEQRAKAKANLAIARRSIQLTPAKRKRDRKKS